MKSSIFINDGSERSNLFFDLYEYKIKDECFFPEESRRKANSFKEAGIDYSREDDERFLEFESYIKLKLSKLSTDEKFMYIYQSTTYISPFLYSLSKFVFYEEDSPNTKQELRDLFDSFYEKDVIQDFIHILTNYDPVLFHIIYNFDIAREIIAFKNGGEFYLHEYDKQIIEKAFEYIILQYEVIIMDILDREKSTTSPQFLEGKDVNKLGQDKEELLKPFRSNLPLYSQLKKAIDQDIIYIHKGKINFPYSQKTITSIFKNKNYSKWKFLENNILTNHDIPSKLGTTPITKTKEFLEFQSKTIS